VLARIALAALIAVVVFAGAAILERRRRREAAPVRDAYPVPRQLTRSDFARPNAPWLVALFSSSTCASCAAMHEKIVVLESAEVAVCDVEFQSGRELHERYEISGVPMVVIADAEGVVHRAFVGPTSATDLWAAVAGVRDPESDAEPELGALP
jgi:thioredoxin-related protein